MQTRHPRCKTNARRTELGSTKISVALCLGVPNDLDFTDSRRSILVVCDRRDAEDRVTCPVLCGDVSFESGDPGLQQREDVTMGAIAILGALIIGLPIVAVPVLLYVSMRGMAGAEKTFRPASPQEFPDDYQVAAQTGQWARSRGFRYLGSYAMNLPNLVFIAAWQLAESPNFFCMYGVRNKYAYDFVTYLAPDRTLTTGNTRDGLMLPRRPGRYGQAFENTDFDTMLRRHQESLAYMQNAGRIAPRPVTKNFEEAFTGALVDQLAYVRSIPLWPLRGLKWYYVDRSRFINKSIEEQHRARLIQLPGDLNWREDAMA